MLEKERIPVGKVGDLVFANIAAVVGAFVFAVVTASQLPARYPSHFNAVGQPDHWSEAGSADWYVMPFFATMMAAFVILIALVLPKFPMESVNVPRKEQFLKLSTAEKTPIIQYLTRFLLWVSLLDTVLFVAINWVMFRSALEGHIGLNWIAIVTVGVVYIGFIVYGTTRASRLVREATDHPPSEGPTVASSR